MIDATDRIEAICKELVSLKESAIENGVSPEYWLSLEWAQAILHKLHVKLEALGADR